MSDDLFKLEYLLALPAYFLILLTAIFLHEMGHYIAARLFGVPVKSVTIGQGRSIKSWTTKNNIDWQLKLWPLSAHVHLENLQERHFITKITTILAGPLINFAVIPFIIFIFYCAFGQPTMPNSVVGVEKGLAADKAGIQVGDKVVAFNAIPIHDNRDMWKHAYKKELTERTNILSVKRNDQTLNIPIQPTWIEYNDLRGVPRENARYGIVWRHAPYKLKYILNVNGIDTNEDDDKTRELLIQHFDQDITLKMKSPVDQDRPFRIHLKSDINQGLLDQDSDFYKLVHLGAIDGNIYKRHDVLTNAKDALTYSGQLFFNVAKLPFQIFPIDKASLRDGAAVSSKNTKIINKLYKLIHLFCVASIAIGLINLIPFPRLDGGQCVDQILHLLRGESLTNKFRANSFAAILLLLYASVFIANMDNLHGYIDSSLKKVHEFIEQDILNADQDGKTE
ncbi:MAG: site-2 protease family protein [Bdellovibrionales bacterium]